MKRLLSNFLERMDLIGKQSSELDDGTEGDRDVELAGIGSRTLSDPQAGSSEDLSSESNTTSTTFNANQDPSESGSSRRQSNSRGKVRQYVRSRLPRLRWTADLHRCFVVAVERCGGQESKWPTPVSLPIDWKVNQLACHASSAEMNR